MNCKHTYFRLTGGVLVCAACGRPAKQEEPDIEDKMVKSHVTKVRKNKTEVK